MSKWFSLLIIWCCLSGNLWANDESGQASKLILDKNNIKIWSYKVPKSPLSGFVATTTVKSSLSGLVSLITDTQNASRLLIHKMQVAGYIVPVVSMCWHEMMVSNFLPFV